MAKPSPQEIRAAVGISRSYAYDVASGKLTPSTELAIRIYRATGWKPSPIAAFSEELIDELEAHKQAQAA